MARYSTNVDNSTIHAFAVGKNARATSNTEPQRSRLTRSHPSGSSAAAAVPATPSVRKEVFVCYSSRDRRWLKRLQVHLSPLVRDDLLTVWDDTKLRAGSRRDAEIEAALMRATIAVLMVSADFLASRFIVDVELPRLLSRAVDHGLRVIPVIVGRSLFEATELSQYQAANQPGTPLAEMRESEVEETFVGLARAIMEM